MDIKLLEEKAHGARLLYKQGKITRQECFDIVILYINAYNAKSKQIAKKYNQNPRLLNFQSYIR
jgi:hypothetical protein